MLMYHTADILKVSATSEPKTRGAVASENNSKDKISSRKSRKRHIPSASTALVLGGLLGLAQAIFLIFGAQTLLGIMGVKQVCS